MNNDIHKQYLKLQIINLYLEQDFNNWLKVLNSCYSNLTYFPAILNNMNS